MHDVPAAHQVSYQERTLGVVDPGLEVLRQVRRDLTRRGPLVDHLLQRLFEGGLNQVGV